MRPQLLPHATQHAFSTASCKLLGVQALVLFSRLGVYLPLPGVDVTAFQKSVQTGGGLLGYIDTLSGGSISRVGVFSLGTPSSQCPMC